MSQENVEIVKRGLDAFNRRDLQGFAVLATEDFEWFPALPGAVEGTAYRGHDGIESYFRESRDTWVELRVLAGELRDLGGRVLVLGMAEAIGRGSGVQVDMPLAFVVEFRGEQMSGVRTYLDHGEALRAAGLDG